MFYKQYTKCNLLFLAIAIILNHPLINTIVLINSAAVCVSFHATYIVDLQAFLKMSQLQNPFFDVKWMTFNFIGHIMPFVVSCFLVLLPRYGIFAAICSSSLHFGLAFVFHKSLYMNSEYVLLSNDSWHKLWLIAFVTHMTVGILLWIAFTKKTI